jgi:hypothetical protein
MKGGLRMPHKICLMTGKKKIKVLQAIRQGQVGGGESHILSLVKHIDKNRFRAGGLVIYRWTNDY